MARKKLMLALIQTNLVNFHSGKDTPASRELTRFPVNKNATIGVIEEAEQLLDSIACDTVGFELRYVWEE